MSREQFFEKICTNCHNDIERTIALLELRGFLLYKTNNGYFLSNNSHEKDIFYLEEILKKYNIGTVENDMIVINNAINYKGLEEEFSENKKIDGVSVHMNYGWDYFRHRYHGYKVPVKILEPFIARYVKAASACGVIMTGCCDGNHLGRKEAFLQITVKGSAAWNTKIIDIANNLCGTKLEINKKGGFPLKNNKYEVYYEMYKVANFLYENRVSFRIIKINALKDYPTIYLKRVNDDNKMEEDFCNNINYQLKTYHIENKNSMPILIHNS